MPESVPSGGNGSRFTGFDFMEVYGPVYSLGLCNSGLFRCDLHLLLIDNPWGNFVDRRIYSKVPKLLL